MPTQQFATVAISTANPNLDGTTGDYGTLLTSAGNGSRVDRIYIKATGATTAGLIRFFVVDGANVSLLHEEAVSAVNPSATVKSFAASFPLPNVFLQPTAILKVSTEKAEPFDVTLFYTEY